MVAYDNIIDKIDTALNERKNSEIFLIYAGLFLIIASIVYLYIYPDSDVALKSAKSRLASINGKISREQSYINSKTVGGDKYYYIKKREANIKHLKQQLQDVIFINGYIDTRLNKLSFLLYDDVNWANFIDNITKNAKKYGVKINFIKNKFNKLDYKKVEQALDIEVDANGNFNNLIKFINSIEESRLVVDIYALKMNIEKSIHANFKIAVWGIKY